MKFTSIFHTESGSIFEQQIKDTNKRAGKMKFTSIFHTERESIFEQQLKTHHSKLNAHRSK